MSDLDTFGKIVTAPDVEQAVMAMLEERLKDYVARIERHAKLKPEFIALPESWIYKNDLDNWPASMLPSVVVTCPGLADKPKMEGDKSFRVQWAVGVGVVVGATSITKAEELSKLYGAAVRECVMQNQSLEGFSEGITWEDERFDELSGQDDLNIAAASEVFSIEVRGAVSTQGGTIDPLEEPYKEPGALDTVESTSTTVIKEDN